MNPQLASLEQLLKNHDWYYDYSDDHSVWLRGQAERNAIRLEQQRLVASNLATTEEVQHLFDAHYRG